MKKVLFSLIAVITFLITGYSYGAEGVISVSSSGNNVLTIQNADDIIFSPKGDKVAMLNKTSFVITDAGYETIKNFAGSPERQTSGNFVCFLPDESVIYNYDTKTFRIKSGQEKGEQALSEEIEGGDPESKSVIIFDDDVIYSGDGSYDWGGKKGNIIKYDLKKGVVTRKCPINGYWYAQLSDSKKYILYEYGSEENNNAYIYDIKNDKNWPVSEYFAFDKIFRHATEEVPIVWLKNKNVFLCGVDVYRKDYKPGTIGETDGYLLLCNAEERKIIWKIRDDRGYFPDDVTQINEKYALINVEDYVYTLNLTNGRTSKFGWLGKVDKLSLSPDGKNLAYFKDKGLHIVKLSYDNAKKVYQAPEDFTEQKCYKGMGRHKPVWSPDGKMIFYLGEFETKVIRL